MLCSLLPYWQQVTGEAVFINDLAPMPGELHAAFVVTQEGNAHIKSIDTSAALVGFSLLYTPQTNVWAVYRNHPVRPFVLPYIMSADIPLNRWTDIGDTSRSCSIYDLRMCIKEDNPPPKNITGDNTREIIICAWQGHPLGFWLTVLVDSVYC